MKYTQLSIKNYKGIQDVEINFSHNRILTLVGLNESGKTTILEALQLFYKLAKDKKLSNDELNQIRPKGIDFTGHIVISGSLHFEETDYIKMNSFLKSIDYQAKVLYPEDFRYDFNFEYEVHSYQKQSGQVVFPIRKTNNSKTLLYKSDNAIWNKLVVFIRTELVPEILYYEDFIFEIPDQITFPITNSTAPGKTTSLIEEWKLVFNDILKTVNPKFTTFQEYVANIWKSDNDTARQRLSAMEKILDEKITKAWKDLFQEGSDQQNQRLNFKEIKVIPVTEEPTTIQFSFKIKTDSGKEFSLNERSKGCKWFFSFLIFTEFRKNRTANILFLLDEPASNLHSSAQLKILNAIESLSDKSVIIYSTHSHHLINPKWLNGAYIVVNEAMSTSNLEGAFTNNDAKITAYKYYKFVSQSNQKHQSLFFQPILDRLDYKPSFLDPVPEIVITEGKNDWYTFKYINEIILDNKYDLNFYPGKGADANEDIMRLYMSWGSNFILLLDSDKKGITAKSTYKQTLGTFVDSKILTYKDVLDSSISTEDLFSEYDINKAISEAFKDIKVSEIKGDKKKLKSQFNFALAILLNSKAKIDIEPETLNKFNNLFSALKSKLSH